ncbi:MAG: hypothetical protein IKR58_02465 [Lachnospiraceae bacterium]|nr:hypothetical protein [Lachnospiraceae bacterium]
MNKRFTKSEILFLLALAFWLTMAVISRTYIKDLFDYQSIREIAYTIAWILLAAKLVADDSFGKKGLLAAILAVLVYFIMKQTDSDKMLLPVMLVLSARNVRCESIFHVFFAVQLPIMICSILLSLTGVIENELWEEAERMRYSLGYTYCTYGSHIFLFLTLAYMALRKKITIIEALILLGLNFLFYTQTLTKTDLLLFVPAITGCYLIGRLHLGVSDARWSRGLLMAAGPVLAGIAITVQYVYDETNYFWHTADTFLRGRISLGHQGLADYGITLFGQKIKWVGASGNRLHPDWVYNYVDCSYLKYLLNYGLIFFILLMLAIVLLGKWVADTRNPGMVIAYLIWLAFGMIDAELFELAFQPFMLLLAKPLVEMTSALFTAPHTISQSRRRNAPALLSENSYRL